MKKLLFICLSFLMPCVVFSQTVIDNPKLGYSTAPYVNIVKIELKDTATVLYFHTVFKPGDWIFIPKETYIQAVDNNQKLYIKASEGISIGEKYIMPESGVADYKLVFPKINNSVSKLDYGEGNDGGSWFIYDIQLKPLQSEFLIPKELSGNWYNTKSGRWEISFLDTLAVYKNKIWNYGGINLKNGKGSVLLKNGKNNISIFIKTGGNDTLLIGESPKSVIAYCKNAPKLVVKDPESDTPYKLPVFKLDSATYSGYLKGYPSRIGMKTMSIHVDDILAGNQYTYLVKVSNDGYFTAKVPLYYPHIVYVRSKAYNGSVFLEPGKEVFQMIDPANKKAKTIFMGECASINSDMVKLQGINSFNYNEVQKNILDMTPAMYKTFCLKAKQKDLDSLEAFKKAYMLSARAYQVSKMDIEYKYSYYLMEYNYFVENAYRKKNKNSGSQEDSPVKTEKVTAEYYNFITNDITNNQFAVLSEGYDSYINRLKYLDILRESGSNKITYSSKEIADELKKSGYSFTNEEKEFLKAQAEMDSLSSSPAEKEFRDKHETQATDFFKKYSDKLRKLYKDKKGESVTNQIIESYLLDNGVIFTDDEKVLIAALKEHDNSEVSIKRREFYNKYKKSMEKFNKDHSDFTSAFYDSRRKKTTYENLQKLLGVNPGFATDIMTAQDACTKIVEQLTPMSGLELQTIKQQISTPFIADYVAYCNQQTTGKLEANKKKTGYAVVNEVPKTEADKLFDGIMKKYRGKVVFVDFWATWCGPCRSGIAEIKPLKEEMAKDSIAFVYITGPSSPEKTWNNMIPDIKGEHFRVSDDEWNYLTSKFNISGIPHYVLVNKKGAVVNPNVNHMSNESLKKELEKYLVE